MHLGTIINFELPEYSVLEPDGQIEVCARVIEGMLARDVTATLSTENLAAIGQ